MITKAVQNLFDFIDYLYSQTNYLLSKQPLIDEVNELISKRSVLRPQDNYKDKLEYDEIQNELEQKFDIVENEIINPIKEKIKYFDIADISTPIVNLTAQSDLFKLQRTFAESDLKYINTAIGKYLEFRKTTNFHYYLQFFFFDLDRDLKEFYDYFKDSDLNEFNNLENTTISIDLSDTQGIEKAVRKFTGKDKLNIAGELGISDSLKGVSNALKTTVKMQKLVDEAVKSGKETMNQFEQEFNKIQKQYEAYFKGNRIISPLDTTDFFSWISMAYPDENLPIIIEVAKNPNSYKRYHDYKERLFNNPDWNNEKEFEYLHKRYEIPEPNEKFSVLEWATIFYYADETKLLETEISEKLINRLEFFMEKHSVKKSLSNFKNTYYEAKRRININQNFPISKLKKILSFMEINYNQTINKIQNDISFLKENGADY